MEKKKSVVGKRKFILAILLVISTTSIIISGMAIGVIFSGDNISSIVLYLSLGIALIAGAISVETIARGGGLKKFVQGYKEEEEEYD